LTSSRARSRATRSRSRERTFTEEYDHFSITISHLELENIRLRTMLIKKILPYISGKEKKGEIVLHVIK